MSTKKYNVIAMAPDGKGGTYSTNYAILDGNKPKTFGPVGAFFAALGKNMSLIGADKSPLAQNHTPWEGRPTITAQNIKFKPVPVRA